MSASIIYLGLDVHKDSIVSAVLPAVAPAPTTVNWLPSDLARLKRYLGRQPRAGTLGICYEESGAGCVLQRTLQAWGDHCVPHLR